MACRPMQDNWPAVYTQKYSTVVCVEDSCSSGLTRFFTTDQCYQTNNARLSLSL